LVIIYQITRRHIPEIITFEATSKRTSYLGILMYISNTGVHLNMMNDFGDEKCRQVNRQDFSIMRLFYALYVEE
jgi:hypothetical protein